MLRRQNSVIGFPLGCRNDPAAEFSQSAALAKVAKLWAQLNKSAVLFRQKNALSPSVLIKNAIPNYTGFVPTVNFSTASTPIFPIQLSPWPQHHVLSRLMLIDTLPAHLKSKMVPALRGAARPTSDGPNRPVGGRVAPIQFRRSTRAFHNHELIISNRSACRLELPESYRKQTTGTSSNRHKCRLSRGT